MYISAIGSFFWHKLGNSQDDYINDAILHRERHLKLAQKSKAVSKEDLKGNFLVEENFNEDAIKAAANERRKSSSSRSGNFNTAINREDSLPNIPTQDADEFYTLKTAGQNNDAEIDPSQNAATRFQEDDMNSSIKWNAFAFKEEAMAADFYSGTFYSFIEKYKDEYNLIEEDQSEYFMESCFLLTIQVVFVYAIQVTTNWKDVTTYKGDFGLDVCQFFTTLILHFASVFSVRNGVQMLKGVIYIHDDHEFKMTHSEAGFFLGVMTCMVNFACQFSNMIGALTARNVPEVLSKFVAFKLLINVQDYYKRSRANFKIAKAVGNPIIIKEDNSMRYGNRENDSMLKKIVGNIFFVIFMLLKFFYNNLYFYFFPFVILYLPFNKLIYIT